MVYESHSFTMLRPYRAVKSDLRRSIQRFSHERARADGEIKMLVENKKTLRKEVTDLKGRLLNRGRIPDFADDKEIRKSMAYAVEACDKKVLSLNEGQTANLIDEFKLTFEMKRNLDDFKVDLQVLSQGWISMDQNGPVITQAGLRVAKMEHSNT